MDGVRILAERIASIDGALLGVERSVNGRFWADAGGDSVQGLAIAQALQIPELVGRMIASRGVAPETIGRFLNPTLRDWLPDPDCLQDMAAATQRLVAAITAGERVAIFGDYDVDGAASSALLQRYLTLLGVPVETYIPDRLTEGYGPNAAAMNILRDRGAGLVICVDCGTLAFQPLAHARSIGLDVIVVDHHAAEPALPPAVAVVNPNRLDDDSGLGNICAATVTFLLLVSVNRALRRQGHFGMQAEPELLSLLDLVALATVCDVMPLTGLNRALVAQGLKIIAQRGRTGLAALADRAQISARIDAYHLGFVLGPRINAGGRVGRSGSGSRLLATDDAQEAQRLAAELELLNAERQEIERALVAEAIATIEAQIDPEASIIVADGTGWHPGVIGIVAARLRERYDRPSCVIGWEIDLGKGSGRSVPGVDLGAAIIAARQAGILSAGGGHAMAAGFTLQRQQIHQFREFMQQRIPRAAPSGDQVRRLHIDAVVHPAGCVPELLAKLEAIGPFGSGNPEPLFALSHARILVANVVGQNHVRCALGAGGTAVRLKAIAFRALGTPLGEALLGSVGRIMHLTGHLRLDRWQGREEVQLQITDAAPVTL